MAVREILLLGNPLLYQVSELIRPEELTSLQSVADDLRDTLLDFRKRFGYGRAIAAPQIGVMKRLIYWHPDSPQVLINPVLEDLSQENFTLWDDCMSFPGLLVKVNRHTSCTLRFRDQHWNEQIWHLQNDRSELIQHEYDHLDGIMATQRAIDDRSLSISSNLRSSNT